MKTCPVCEKPVENLSTFDIPTNKKQALEDIDRIYGTLYRAPKRVLWLMGEIKLAWAEITELKAELAKLRAPLPIGCKKQA